MLLPRSFFLTVFQDEFFTAKIAQLETPKVTFDQLLPKLLKAMPQLDSIVAGVYTQEESVRRKHEDYLAGTNESHGIIMGDMCGQYSETVIFSIAQYLRTRYMHQHGPIDFEMDPRFSNLTKEKQKSYIVDVIVPEAMILITQQDFLGKAFNNTHARYLAMDHLNERNIVSLIKDLRAKIKD